MSLIPWLWALRAFYGKPGGNRRIRGCALVTFVRGKLLVFFNNKRILLLSRVFFAIGSALTAASPTMNAFIVGKAITGFGSNGTYISVIFIITALTSAKDQGRYFGYIGFMWGLGTVSVRCLFSFLSNWLKQAQSWTCHWGRLCCCCRRLALGLLLQPYLGCRDLPRLCVRLAS